MKRGIIVAGALAVALIALWKFWPGAEPGERDTRSSLAKKQSSDKSRALTRTRPAARTDSMSYEYDEEREGDLVLEGQVIDGTEDPVTGALVTLQTTPRRTVKTGKDGFFAFDKLIGRSYTLVAQSDAGAGGPLAFRLTETSDPVIVRLRPAASVRVRVLDLVSNQPVINADVELRGVQRQRATTDDAGLATLVGVPAGFYQLAASAAGYVAAFERMRVPDGDAALDQDVRLRAGAPVSGRVVTMDGVPIAEARVVFRQGSAGWRQQADARYDAVTTDREGNFRFAALPAGGVYFQADHDEHARGYSETIDIDGVSEKTGIEIRLDKGVTIAGRVVDSKRSPVPYAGVRTLVGNGGRRWRGRPRQSFADADGTFEITGLPRSSVQILATAENSTSETLEVELTEVDEKRDLELTVDQNGRIAGIVVNSTGEPIEGAQVSIRPDFQFGAGGRAAMRKMFSDLRLRGLSNALSDAGGRFEFTGLQEKDYVVSASPPGVSTSRRGRFRGRDDNAVNAKVGDTDVRVELEAMGTITGKVAFADGSVPEIFTVSTGGFRSPARPFATRDGAFSVGDLAPSSYRVVIRGAGFDDKHLSPTEVAAGQSVDLGTITVVKGRSVSGRVVDASGGPVQNATVYVGRRLRGSGTEQEQTGGFGPFAQSSKSSTTDETGYYAIQGLPEGYLAIVAEHAVEGRSTAQELPSAQKDISDLQLRVVPPGAVAGTIYVNGTAAESARVTARSQTIPSISYRVSSGPDGAYRFERLAPDSYLVSASVGDGLRGGRGTYSEATVVKSGETIPVDFRIDAGSAVLLVKLVPAQGETGFARIYTVQGALQATTPRELEAALANRTTGFSTMNFAIQSPDVRVEQVPVGEATVCAIVYPAELDGPGELMPYIQREGERLPVFCQAVAVADGASEQRVDLPVTVPAYVPPPAE